MRFKTVSLCLLLAGAGVGCGDDDDSATADAATDGAVGDARPVDAATTADTAGGTDATVTTDARLDAAATDAAGTDAAAATDAAGTDAAATDAAGTDAAATDAAATTDGSAADAPVLSAAALRGKYLVDTVLGCGDCHTPRGAMGRPDMSKYLAGVSCFVDIDPDATKGCLSSKNLTNHETGLKNVTSDLAVRDMIRDGKRPDGKFINSVMPYWEYHNLTDADADAIVAYLRTVPGVDNRPAANTTPFDVQPTAAVPFVDLADVPAVMAGAANEESAKRGRYLAAVACISCHTPETTPPNPAALPVKKELFFAGARAFPASLFGLSMPPFPMTIYTQNLTPDATGLKDWTADDIIKVLKMGKDKMDKGVCPPMPAGPQGPFANLTDADARDLANYLLVLPAKVNALPNQCALP